MEGQTRSHWPTWIGYALWTIEGLRRLLGWIGEAQTAKDVGQFVRDRLPGLPIRLPAMPPIALSDNVITLLVTLSAAALVLWDQRRTRAMVLAHGGPPPAIGRTPLLCIHNDIPFNQGEIAGFLPNEVKQRLGTYRWVPVPPSESKLRIQRAMSFLRLAEPPAPILLFRADEQPNTDVFVTVTNYGATAELAAWALLLLPLTSQKLSGAGEKYPLNWRENGHHRTIRLRRNESATLHLAHSEIMHDPPSTPEIKREGYILSYESIKDWQIITLLGADGKDTARQFLSHPLYWNDGVVNFMVMIECPSKPITEPPASAYYQIENMRDSASLRITRRE